jgi:transcriptional regulator with XRE-family HTH domain
MPRSRSSPRRTRLQVLLAEERRAAGLTQVELAAQLCKPQSYVSKYESGERRLDVIEFLEIVEILGIRAINIIIILQSEQK